MDWVSARLVSAISIGGTVAGLVIDEQEQTASNRN